MRVEGEYWMYYDGHSTLIHTGEAYELLADLEAGGPTG